MKKKLLIAMAVILALLAIVIIGTSLDEPLSPSARKSLEYKLPEIAPADNAYVGISGLGYVQEDLVAAGLKYLAKGYQGGSDQRRKFESDYKNPCLPTGGPQPDCLNRIAADAAVIDEVGLKNSELIERYQALIKMPLFLNTSLAIDDPTPLYQAPLDVSRFYIGVKALMELKLGDPAAGLEAIEADLDFYKMIVRSERVSLIELMIAMAAIDCHLIGLNKAIADGGIDLREQEDRLRKMLELDFKAGLMMEAALTTEDQVGLRGLADWSNIIWIDDRPALKDRLKAAFHRFLYKKNMTINRLAAMNEQKIESLKAAPLLGFPDYYAQRLNDEDEAGPSYEKRHELKNLYKEYGLFFFKNYSGESILGIAQPMYSRYLARINDSLVHSRLVRAQLELRLMEPGPEDVPAALAKLGPETWNPYTGQPFAWDADKKVIWFERVGSSDSAKSRVEAGLPERRP